MSCGNSFPRDENIIRYECATGVDGICIRKTANKLFCVVKTFETAVEAPAYHAFIKKD